MGRDKRTKRQENGNIDQKTELRKVCSEVYVNYSSICKEEFVELQK